MIRMKKNAIAIYVFSLMLPVVATSCSSGQLAPDTISEGVVDIPHVPGQWTYFSLTRGTAMGQCSAKDTAAQAQWKQRTDWDIAICNGMLRTNSGASGIGRGGIYRTTGEYDDIQELKAPQYATDKDTLVLSGPAAL